LIHFAAANAESPSNRSIGWLPSAGRDKDEYSVTENSMSLVPSEQSLSPWAICIEFTNLFVTIRYGLCNVHSTLETSDQLHYHLRLRNTMADRDTGCWAESLSDVTVDLIQLCGHRRHVFYLCEDNQYNATIAGYEIAVQLNGTSMRRWTCSAIRLDFVTDLIKSATPASLLMFGPVCDRLMLYRCYRIFSIDVDSR